MWTSSLTAWSDLSGPQWWWCFLSSGQQRDKLRPHQIHFVLVAWEHSSHSKSSVLAGDGSARREEGVNTTSTMKYVVFDCQTIWIWVCCCWHYLNYFLEIVCDCLCWPAAILFHIRCILFMLLFLNCVLWKGADMRWLLFLQSKLFFFSFSKNDIKNKWMDRWTEG